MEREREIRELEGYVALLQVARANIDSVIEANMRRLAIMRRPPVGFGVTRRIIQIGLGNPHVA